VRVLVRIRHTVRSKRLSLEGQLRDILEHLRYSNSWLREWSIKDGQLTIEAEYKGSLRGWRMVKDRAVKSFMLSIEDERRLYTGDSYRPRDLKNSGVLKQCIKCRHIWRPETHLRKDGMVAKRCPKCGSNQTLDTHKIVTKVWKREDLLIFTDGKYPEKYCPRTSYEELHPEVIAQVGDARIMIGRGWGRPEHGHKVILFKGRRHVMDTSYQERQSMKGAVAWCPPNARVFVGGLGLGLILLYLAKTGKAREVVVCEINPDIIALVEPKLRKWFDKHYPQFNWKVIQGDALQEVLKGEPYDWIFMDLWKTAYDYDAMKRAEEIAKQNLTPRGRVTCWMKSTYEKKRRKR